MNLFEDIKTQLKADSISDSNLPWTFDNSINNSEEKTAKKLDTKKIATLGLILFIGLIVAIAIFNFITNSNSISVEASESSTEVIKTEIQVHVGGEVAKPGLYKLEDGARVNDAIEVAGGFTENADKDSLNLAKVLEDGEQIMIPSKGGGSSEAGSSASQTNNGKVNINTADLTTLQTLNGVGPATAQKIIDYRTANGKFKTIEDLKKVSGIGEKTFAKFKDQICV